MSGFRVSYVKASGWTRLGLAGAVAVLFGTPMLWALGTFGAGDDALHRGAVFGLAGLWFAVATGYLVGWAVQGFVIRTKAATDEEADEQPSRPSPPPPPRGGPPQRSGSH